MLYTIGKEIFLTFLNLESDFLWLYYKTRKSAFPRKSGMPVDCGARAAPGSEKKAKKADSERIVYLSLPPPAGARTPVPQQPIPLNLTEIERQNPNFSAQEISDAIVHQVGCEGYIIMDKNGAVMRMANTEGIGFWGARRTLYAVSRDIYCQWRPENCAVLQGTYSFDTEEFVLPPPDNVDVAQPGPSGIHIVRTSSPIVPAADHGIQTSPSPLDATCSCRQHTAELSREVRELMDLIRPTAQSSPAPVPNTVRVEQVEQIFRCQICFEAQPQRYYSCPWCVRYIGCYDCVVPRLEICPTCRQGLPSNPHPAPSIIPGAADLIRTTNPVPVPPAQPQPAEEARTDQEDDELDDTLPVVPF